MWRRRSRSLHDDATLGTGHHRFPIRRCLLRGQRQRRSATKFDEPQLVPQLAFSLLFIHVFIQVVQYVVQDQVVAVLVLRLEKDVSIYFALIFLSRSKSNTNIETLLWLKKVYHVFHKLGPVSAHSLDSLENVNFSMLNDLFYACVGGTIDPATTPAIGRDHSYWSVVRSLPPSLNHIHELY